MARRTTIALLLLAALAGCGSDKSKPADATQVKPAGGNVAVKIPKAGVTFEAPAGWRRQKGRAPLVYAVQTGQATLALWRYPRTEQLPVTHKALQAAKEALVAQIRKRDPTFKVTRAKLLHVGPKRAVQVLGTGAIAGNRRTIRSTHIYTEKAEFVVDAYAPPTVFDRVDQQVFAPVLDSLQIAKPKE
ncbi:MAG TPA: hypothetical protein VGJ32_08920 [Solirubrobacteraceae bacterium]